jgi:hypothetical protein
MKKNQQKNALGQKVKSKALLPKKIRGQKLHHSKSEEGGLNGLLKKKLLASSDGKLLHHI